MSTATQPFPGVAASPAAAILSNPATAAIADLRPIEQPSVPDGVDLADPASEKIWRANLWMDALVRLEELYPADPGERSGCCIRVCLTGKEILLGVYFATHHLGSLDAGELAGFFSRVRAAKRGRRGTAVAYLWELCEPLRFAGIKLEYFHGSSPELRVTGESGHCFGVTRGRELEALLDTISFRLRKGVQ